MNKHARRSLMLTGLIAIIALSIGLLPQSSSAARATVEVAGTNKSWSNGRFFRTGLAREQNGRGGIQLVPIKVQRNYTATNQLPIPLSSHSSVVYRNRIFVLGGNTLVDGSLVKSHQVFSTRRKLDNTNGALEEWETLPPMVMNNTPVALSDMASVVVTVNNNPYIVALGGLRTRVGASTVSTNRIYAYPITMDADGVLTGNHLWQEVTQRLPHNDNWDDCGDLCPPGFLGSGAADISAVSVTLQGTPYIYLFGGFNRTWDGARELNKYFSMVVRAPVSVNNAGQLVIGNWEWTDSSVTIQDGSGNPAPLAGAATVTYQDPLTNSTGVYLIGGSNGDQPGDKDPNAYVAVISNTTTGVNIAWKPNGEMSLPRSAHAAVQSDGLITVTGGWDAQNQATTSAALGYIEPDLSLYRDPINTDLANFEFSMGGLNAERANHTMEAVDGSEFDDFAYLIGGITRAGSATVLASQDVLYGNLDEPPQEGDNVVALGTYYSKVFNFGQDAKYFGMHWSASLPTGATFSGNPIELSYRIGNDPFNLGAPVAVPVTTVNGQNTFTFPLASGLPPTGQYIQFIATLKASTANQSPILNTVKIEVERVGFPNVKKKAGTSDILPGTITASTDIVPNVQITNEDFVKADGTVIKAIDANWDGDGTFFVDMYVTFGATANPPALGDVGAVYAEVPEPSLTVNSTYSIPNDRRVIAGTSNAANKWTWRPGTCTAWPCPLVNWNNVFPVAGTYTVYLMVDSDNVVSQFANVTEAELPGQDGESDNIYGPFTVNVTTTMPKLFVPFVVKQATSPLAASAETPVAPQPREHTRP